MNILFVHGMGRSPFSAYFFLRRLRKLGRHTETFFYVAARADSQQICQKLSRKLKDLENKGPYVVIGHSLGGVLLRKTLQCGIIKAPHKMFLLGPPHSGFAPCSKNAGKLLVSKGNI